MSKFICSICGYVYDESIGDPDKGIARGTRWEDVPEDWNCPLCGAAKADFAEEKLLLNLPRLNRQLQKTNRKA